ncbi:MAG: AAA family ATPase [Ardenticatenaceae bacterium]|nr:AAA family ATPase [Ardenticatenaceae bacterium]MCB9005219.1 AAA family ATPase [Ardenticatenaceae bacterium]
MSHSLTEIAQQLKDANKKVQLIYAFNGTGKTRLSREFKQLIAPKNISSDDEDDPEPTELSRTKILYYNAFTEDLFYWDNDLEQDADLKLIIQPNSFTDWVLIDQGQDFNIITNFQRYTNDKLTPHFNETFSEITFTIERGDDQSSGNIKISKGEESNFIWSLFYTLIDQVIAVLNVAEPSERETNQFDQLEYIFIDDPVSSLDENHLIESAVDLAQLIKSSESSLKFIITTHNPLFYNVLHNEFKRANRYMLKKNEDGTYLLNLQGSDSPFSYHLHLKAELEKAIQSGQLHKYHYNFIRNILEKTATFLGHDNWGDLLPESGSGANPYETRIINISSHSKHAGEEVAELTDDDKRVLRFLINKINEKEYHFKQAQS